jgi:hypothetical protein
MFDKLNYLTNVTNFFRNCTSLECHYTVNDLGEKITHLNTISEDLFKNNTRLVYAPSMFYNCTKIKGFIPPLLFDSCRNTILNVSSMFYNCTGLSGIDQDGDLGLIGLSDSLFLNCKSLNYVQGFMQSCTGYSCFVPERLFSGCVSLRNTSSMFASCKSLQGGLSRILFDSCRKTLENVASMFAASTISGDIPEGDYRIVQGIKSYRVCLPSEEGAKQVLLGEKITNPETQISYSVVLEWNPDLSSSITYDGSSYVMPVLGDTLLVEELGFLSDCINLTTTAGMFSDCDNITGGIPSDLFYSSDPFATFKITTTANMFYHCHGLNKSYIDTNTNETYYIPSDLFRYCPLLEYTNNMFQYCSLPTADLPNTLFDKQSKIVSVANMFYSTNVSGFITQNFLKNCISSLNNAQGFFSGSRITNIASGFLNLGGKNNMSNTITIELCAEDRARLNKLAAALEKRAAQADLTLSGAGITIGAVQAAAEPQEAAEEEAPQESTQEPESDAPAEKVEPTVTLEQIQQKVVQLAAAGADKKAKVREIINAYGTKVSDLKDQPEKWDEVWQKLTALEG